jgi:hypothetical protein
MPVNWQTQRDIVDLYFRKRESDQRAGGPSSEAAGIIENIRACVEQIEVTRKPSRVSGPPEDVIDQIERAGIGFRADDLMRLGMGEALPESVRVAYESACYPDQEIVTEGEQGGADERDERKGRDHGR